MHIHLCLAIQPLFIRHFAITAFFNYGTFSIYDAQCFVVRPIATFCLVDIVLFRKLIHETDNSLSCVAFCVKAKLFGTYLGRKARIDLNADYQRSKNTMKNTVCVAAGFSGISFFALLIGFPFVVRELTSMDKELLMYMDEYNKESNIMWNDLMEQNRYRRSAYDQGGSEEEGGTTDENDKTYSGSGGPTGSYSRGPKGKQGKTESRKESECPSGPAGPPGIPGEKGMDGENGVPGVDGMDGVNLLGAMDEKCKPCPRGPAGYPGYKGKRGPRGPRGPKGSSGSPGEDGAPGDEGEEGEYGPQGDEGPQGPSGPPGEEGITYGKRKPGPKGAIGMPGPVGDEGPPGESGYPGSTGNPGASGPMGPKGLPGKRGPTGPKGKRGNAGSDGEYCSCPERVGPPSVRPITPIQTETSEETTTESNPKTKQETKSSAEEGYDQVAKPDRAKSDEAYGDASANDKKESLPNNRLSNEYTRKVDEEQKHSYESHDQLAIRKRRLLKALRRKH